MRFRGLYSSQIKHISKRFTPPKLKVSLTYFKVSAVFNLYIGNTLNVLSFNHLYQLIWGISNILTSDHQLETLSEEFNGDV